MPIYIQDIEQKRVGTGVIPAYQNEDFPASFPISLWGTQASRYLEYWRQYTGMVWTEEVPNSTDINGNPYLRWPLQINYIKSACMKHSYVLFGEVADGPWPLAPIKCSPQEDNDDALPSEDERVALKKVVKKAERYINQVWVENDGRELQQEGGLTQTYLGGYVLRIGWSPEDENLRYGIRLENVLPDFFLPVWDSGHPGELLEAWVVFRMPMREANIRFNYELSEGMSDPLYIEHWTKDKINIYLNNKPLVYTLNGVELNYDNADNPFGFVPFEYIPRERSGGYYGLSLLDDILGLAKELNTRMADIGDVVGESSHRELFVKNLSQAPKTQDIGGTRPAINLGFTATGMQGEPDAFAIDPPNVSVGIADFPETLRKQFGRDVFVPGVAEGEDEGSQRSALTLAFRMWPLTAKVRAVRTYWTGGLIRAAKKILKMGIIKKVFDLPYNIIDLIDWSVEWSPMIPRDREQDLNEIVMAEQTNMLSPSTGLSLLRLVDDPLGEYAKVQQHIAWLAQVTAASKPAGAGGSSAGSTPPPKVKIQAPVAETIMSEPKS